MPQLVQQPTRSVPAPFVIQWTRDDCERFVAQGILQDGRYELIEGQIIRKMGQKIPHASSVARLFAFLLSLFGEELVRTQATIDVRPEDNPTNEPEPDIYVLSRSEGEITTSYPAAGDIQLVGEVSDSTLDYDLSTKAGLYARAGIPEYWVLDVNGRGLTVHRDPQDGIYQQVVRYAADERVAPLSHPEARVVVSTLLPKLL